MTTSLSKAAAPLAVIPVGKSAGIPVGIFLSPWVSRRWNLRVVI